MAFLFCLVSTIANAQNLVKEMNKKVVCSDLNRIVSILAKAPISELPTWSGQDGTEKTNYVIFHNEKTGSFTILQFDDKTACILGEGTKSQFEKSK